MATPTTIQLCRDIVTSNKEPQVVVVSAPGKYGIYQTKITDDLIRYTKGAPILTDILLRFKDIARELLPQKQYRAYIKILRNTELAIQEAQKDYDFIVSRGEYLSAQLFALYLGYKFVDAYDILVINPDATINLSATKKQIKLHCLKRHLPFVIGGFYGQRAGKTALFTRGGSDYTGAILAALMQAEIYKNYTDTNGIQTANPRLVYGTRTIPCLDFNSLDILTHNGAGIIHENVAKLLEAYHVPLRVDNTFNPHQNFTEVHSQRCRHCQHNFFCVTNKDNHILVVKKKHGKPVTVQIFESNPQSLTADMQRLHLELEKQL
ncbi:MAG: hypothetical protein MJ060_00395 [Clostridia bacterium]|nr:hypothetical protein [Clostridia bacterium]